MSLPLFATRVKPKGLAGSATRIAFDTLLGVLPPGAPTPFREIVSASFVGAWRHRQIIAKLQMIDGLPATVIFTRWSLGWSHRYELMPGGAMSFEAGEWVRVQDDENLDQPDLNELAGPAETRPSTPFER